MAPIELTADRLRELPLPLPEAGSKEERGTLLVVGGSIELPGAALLAGRLALGGVLVHRGEHLLGPRVVHLELVLEVVLVGGAEARDRQMQRSFKGCPVGKAV